VSVASECGRLTQGSGLQLIGLVVSAVDDRRANAIAGKAGALDQEHPLS
jgi:hypothetical protein